MTGMRTAASENRSKARLAISIRGGRNLVFSAGSSPTTKVQRVADDSGQSSSPSIQGHASCATLLSSRALNVHIHEEGGLELSNEQLLLRSWPGSPCLSPVLPENSAMACTLLTPPRIKSGVQKLLPKKKEKSQVLPVGASPLLDPRHGKRLPSPPSPRPVPFASLRRGITEAQQE
jgi:hypothetical protein